MSSPSDRLYSESHEWYQVEGDTLTVGITQYAANELTDITYVEMQPSGTSINTGDSVGEVESVKTTSDVYSVFGGEIIEVNEAATADPALLNNDPFGDGWLVKLRSTGGDTGGLLDQGAYDAKYPLD